MRKFPFLKDFRQRQGAAGGFLLDAEEGIPSELGGHAGVYVIEATDDFKFPYPKGNSKVIYIGKADDLRARLKQHRHRLNQLIDTDGKYGLADDEPWVSSKYQYMYYHGARVFFYKCLGKQEAKELEARVMWSFYKKYRALPVGNGAKSYSKE